MVGRGEEAHIAKPKVAQRRRVRGVVARVERSGQPDRRGRCGLGAGRAARDAAHRDDRVGRGRACLGPGAVHARGGRPEPPPDPPVGVGRRAVRDTSSRQDGGDDRSAHAAHGARFGAGFEAGFGARAGAGAGLTAAVTRGGGHAQGASAAVSGRWPGRAGFSFGAPPAPSGPRAHTPLRLRPRSNACCRPRGRCGRPVRAGTIAHAGRTPQTPPEWRCPIGAA